MWSIALKLLPYAMVALIALGIVWKIYDYGYDNAWDKQEARYQAMIEREEKRVAVVIQQTRNYEVQIRELESKLNEEAIGDPNANRPALGIDSVRRLNRIR